MPIKIGHNSAWETQSECEYVWSDMMETNWMEWGGWLIYIEIVIIISQRQRFVACEYFMRQFLSVLFPRFRFYLSYKFIISSLS